MLPPAEAKRQTQGTKPKGQTTSLEGGRKVLHACTL